MSQRDPHSLKGFYEQYTSLFEPVIVLRRHYLTLTDNNYCAALILDRLYGHAAYFINYLRVTYQSTANEIPSSAYQVTFSPNQEGELTAFGLFDRETMIEALFFLEAKGYIEILTYDDMHWFMVFLDKINPGFWENEPEDDEAYDDDRPKEICIEPPKKSLESKRVTYHLKRAEVLALPATLTLEQWLATLEYYQWQCAYCQQSPYKVFEHFTPLFHGGGTTYNNCVPACARCNVRKSDLHPSIFRDKIGAESVDRVQQYLRACRSGEDVS